MVVRPRVVAIDDDRSTLALIEAVLKPTCDIEGHFDPAAGVLAVLARPPALVMTDFLMPSMTGAEVIEAIRALHPARSLPIIVLSSRGDEEVILQCFSLGATDYLMKPVVPGELRAKVQTLLARARLGADRTALDTKIFDREPDSGRFFAGYRIERQLGEGATGTVFEAIAPDGRRVALKRLRDSVTSDRKVLKRFFREAENLKAVHHANVAAFYELGHESLEYYLAMEYVDGPPIDRALPPGQAGERPVIELVLQVARALDALDRAGIVHRDLKPANVLVTSDGVVKLVDFGLTRSAANDKITETNALMGTPTYIAPEQVRGISAGDIRSDLYALGVMMYYLLTGSRPFRGATTFQILLQHADERPRSPRELTPALTQEVEAIVLKLLEKKPEDRYQTPAALEKVLAEHLAPLS